MKLSDYVVDYIARQGVRHIFEMVGGAITHLVDSVHGRRDIACVPMHHEQAAAFAAEAYARLNGRLGAAMATSGPGALNMLTPIGSCYFDSVPCLFLTGQVNTYEYKFDRPVRQIGFQETDIVSVAKPLTKYAALVADARDIRYCLEKAVFLARSGRPGPVLLDIPMNVQRAQVDPRKLKSFYGSAEHGRLLAALKPAPPAAVKKAAALLREAKRPLILAGGGVRASGAAGELEKLVKRTGVPVVCSLMGLDAIDHGQRAFAGMIGSYGTRYSNLALANCDLLLVLGSRLDTRQTGARTDTFARGARVVHVDIDPSELGAKVKPDLAVRADAGDFLRRLNTAVKGPRPDLRAWQDVIAGYRRDFPEVETRDGGRAVNPNRFMRLLSELAAPGDIICVDVGQNQMWAAQSFRLKKGQRLLTSGGMGSMGFALPAAIGAALAAPGRRVLAICGDGGIQVNIQDMDSLPARRLPVKVILMNNGCLGMVRQFQDLYFKGRRQSTLIGYNCPDLKGIIGAYGVPGRTISGPAGAAAAVRRALSGPGPRLLEVKLPSGTAVEPKLEFNRPIEDMSPVMPREKLKKAMLIETLPEPDEKD